MRAAFKVKVDLVSAEKGKEGKSDLVLRLHTEETAAQRKSRLPLRRQPQPQEAPNFCNLSVSSRSIRSPRHRFYARRIRQKPWFGCGGRRPTRI